MPAEARRCIVCGMESTPGPQGEPAASDGRGLVLAGITALVAKRILETKGEAIVRTDCTALPDVNCTVPPGGITASVEPIRAADPKT
jgi:hypothetical protein